MCCVRLVIAGLLVLCGLTPATAASAPGSLCGAAIAAVEPVSGLPLHLLAAIGLVESGRRNPHGGGWVSWPWTIDAAGEPAFFDSKEQAVAAVRALQARGVQSIDIGCMQVNLAQHPRAFASLDAAFDPASNVRYAAQFLNVLFVRSKAWPAAAALYHSATPDIGAAYRRRVLALWPDGARLDVAAPTRPDPRSELVRAWAATLAGDTLAPTSVWQKNTVASNVE